MANHEYMRALARRQRPGSWACPGGPARHVLTVRLELTGYRDAIRAARLEGGSVSAFLRAAVQERTARVLGESERPRVRR